MQFCGPETIELLQQNNAWKAIDQVKAQIPEFDIALTTVNELNKNLTLVETSLKPFFYAAVCNHDITQRALKILEQEQINTQLLGELMNKHHHLLKSYLKITPPLMDKMIDAANDSGALGSKIVGSGGGGCMVAIVKDQYQKQIIEAIKASGAEDAFAVNITKGATFK